MGFSDSPNKSHLLSAHDINGCNFLTKPSKELQELCRISPSNERATGRVLFAASLKVELPEVMAKEMEVAAVAVLDGLLTPTSLDHKIPTLVCPPAPRKPKSIPAAGGGVSKRKGCRKRVFLDLTNEIDSLFPAAVRADFGNKIRKVRKEIS